MRIRFKAYFRITIPFILSLFLLCTVTFANGAMPADDPSGNGGFIFVEDPDIALSRESITFKVTESSLIYHGRVTVEYDMINLLDREQHFDMLFVAPPIIHSLESQTPNITLNGTDITGQTYFARPEMPKNWKPSLPKGLIEPISKKVIQEKLDDQTEVSMLLNQQQLNGIYIPVIIKAKETTKLVIEYTCESGFNRRPAYKNTIYSFLYYMTPAKFWNGEPNIQLNVELPNTQNFAFHSSIPMKEITQNLYTAQLNKLPDQEWIFSFVGKQGLIYGTNFSKTHNSITLIIASILFVAAFIAARYYKKKYYLILGYILSVLYLFAGLRKMVDGYLGDFVLWIAIFVVLVLIIPSVYYLNSKESQGM